MVTYRNVGQRGVVDPVVSDATASTVPAYLATAADGTGLLGMVLSPKGLTGVNPGGTTNVTLSTAHLPWLRSTATNFLEYRVTRARLTIVGNVGSTTSGQVSVATTTDMIDVFASPAPAFGDLIAGGTNFALADLASANKSVNMRIDSSWKKVTAVTTQLVGGIVINNSNADDLCFSAFVIRVTGAPQQVANVLTTYVDYDVEFRGVASIGFNA